MKQWKKILWCAGLGVLEAVSAEAPGQIQLHGGFASLFSEKEPVTFSIRGVPAEAVYKVEDAFGRTVISRNVVPGEKVELKALERGYYIIRQGKLSRSFAVIRALQETERNPESSFCLDVAAGMIGSVYQYDPANLGNGLRFFADLARLSGAAMARERIGMTVLDKEGNLRADNRAVIAIRNLEERKIPACVTYHKAPAAHSVDGVTPNDLGFVYNFAKNISRQLPGVTIWEFWNEQDTPKHWPGSAWDFASFCKAASLGHKAGNSACRVTAGNLAKIKATNAEHIFFNTAARSGLAYYTDFNSVHSYRNPFFYTESMKRWRDLGRNWGYGDMAVLVSESGSSADSRQSGTVPTGYRNCLDHSPEVEMLVAEFIPKAQIAMRQVGAIRHFHFVLPPCNERNGRKPFGLIRYDFTAKPGFVVFNVLCNELGRAKLEGKVRLAEDVEAYVFRQPNDTQTLVFWRPTWVDREAINSGYEQKARGDYPAVSFRMVSRNGGRLVNAFGTPEPFKRENGFMELSAERFPKYLHGLSGIEVDVPAEKPGKSGRLSFDGDLSIVTRLVPGKGTNISERSRLLLVEPEHCRVKIQIANFDDKTKTGYLKHGGRLTGLPEKIVLNPWEILDFHAEVVSAKAFDLLTIAGSFEGREITPLEVPLVSIPRLKENMKPLAMNPEFWNRNCAGGADSLAISWDESEKALRFDVHIPERVKDLWVYPELLLDQFAEAQTGCRGVLFDIKTVFPAETGKPIWNFVMLDTRPAEAGTLNVTYTQSDGDWKTNFAPLTGREHCRPYKIRIGMNPQCRTFTFYLRNIGLVY